MSSVATDRLSGFLQHFDLKARVFNTGALCGAYHFDVAEGVAHLHLVQSGRVRIDSPDQNSVELPASSLVFFMRPTSHSLVTLGSESADTICASIDFGIGVKNPLTKALPPSIVIDLATAPSLARLLDLFFEEAFAELCGRQSALDRFCELLVIHILRHAMQNQDISVGMLAGLADVRLAKALIAIHNQPANNWTLDQLADHAGMSRARFAVNFRETVGVTPGDYLTSWRLAIAQNLLKKGRSTNLVANDIGYSGAAALSRIFKTSLGMSPREWLKQSGY